MKFALEKPAFRILVNTQAALGAVGYTNGLEPSMTLGPGTWGGSIISENVTARHLINYKRLAFETHPINPEDGVAPPTVHRPVPSPSASWMEEIDRRIIMKAGNPVMPGWKKEDTRTPAGPTSATVYGSGISAEEVDRIIESFSKDLK
jgi:acetaldehyde dehydrogenase (acetylating)